MTLPLRQLVFLLVMSCGLALFLGCSHDEPPPTAAPVDSAILAIKSVGPEGGTMRISGTGTIHDGTILVIPPGALSQTVVITISTVQNPASPEGVSLGFAPSGLTFNTTATLTIPYTDPFVPMNILLDDTGIKVVSTGGGDGDGEHLTVLARDTGGNTVTVALLHFSTVTAASDATQPAFFHQVLPRTGPKVPLAEADSSKIAIIVHGECSDGNSFDRGGCQNGLVDLFEKSVPLQAEYPANHVKLRQFVVE